MFSGVQQSVREWTLTLTKELPLWELESQWTLESSEGDCRGQNSMAWGIAYIVENLLEFRCLKWAHITHLDIWKTSYGQKKSRESNCQFDSRPLKVKNWLDFVACRWRATYCWKTFDKGYNFALDLISIGGLHTKLWRPKVTGAPTFAILGVPGQKTIWMWALWVATKYTRRGKGVASPKFGPWWILWVRICPWLVLTPKVFQLCTNHLVLVLCRSMWIVDVCHFS
jgi:hypothetical protein